MSDDNTLPDEMQDFNVDDFLGDTPPESLSVPDNIANSDEAQPSGNMPKSPDFKLAKKPDYLNRDGNTLVTTEDGETAELRIWRDKFKIGDKVTIHCLNPDHQDLHASAWLTLKENGLFWSCSSCGEKGWCNDDKSTVSSDSKSGKKKKDKAPRPEKIAMSLTDSYSKFMDQQKNTYAEIITNGRKTILPILSPDFGDIIRVAYYNTTEDTISSQVLNNVVATLNAIVKSGDNVEIVAFRNYYDKENGYTYIDVGDDAGRVIKVDRDGYRYITDSKVKFITNSSILALPDIAHKGDITLLSKHLNITEREMPIAIGFLTSTLAGVYPYLHLNIRGVSGSSKSVTARAFQALVDPSIYFSGAITNSADFALACANGYLIIQDNVTKISREMANDMCIASSYGTKSKKTLYTNAGLFTLIIHNPLITTSIIGIDSFKDLNLRTATLDLPPMPKSERKSEDAFWKAFDKDKSVIFTGILDRIVSGYKHKKSIKLESLPRTADAGEFIQASEQDLGISGDFMKVFDENQAMIAGDSFDESPACSALLSFMTNRRQYKGPVTQLLGALKDSIGIQKTYVQDWPDKPNALTKIIEEFKTSFEEKGLHIIRKKGTGGVRNYIITNSNYKPANGLKSVTDNSSGSVPFMKLVTRKNDDNTES
ncbi:MAG: hypothetical protein QM500_21465 [Methylococcales bacterium]